jgi:hypothetical protein
LEFGGSLSTVRPWGEPPNDIDARIELVVGRIENTLEDFLDEKERNFSLSHLDMDLYKPTIFTLELLKPYLVPGVLILFDEHHGYPGWKNGEFKALNEILDRSDFRYLAFGPYQALIKIL